MRYPLWKPILLVIVVLGCALLLKTKGLSPGIDLAGDTTLTYAVQVPAGQNSQTAIEQTIEILKKRVDPTGTMNLIWRAEAGDRLSVQMALAPPEVAEKRAAFDAVRDELVAENLPADRIHADFALPGDQRRAKAGELAQAYPAFTDQFEKLDILATQRESADTTYRAALEAFNAATTGAGEEPDEATTAQLAELRNDLDLTTMQALDERDAFDVAMGELFADNLTQGEFTRVIELTTKIGKDKTESPRTEGLNKLKAQHPGRAALIDRATAAWAEYEDIKGQLDDPQDLIRLLRGAGVLEFRIAASPGTRPIDVQRYKDRLTEQGPKAGRSEQWRWFEIANLEDYLESPRSRAVILNDPAATGQVFANERNVVAQHYGGKFYVLLANTLPLSLTEAQDWELAGATVQQDERGLPAVGFALDAPGGLLMGRLTETNMKQPMAIVLDGQLFSSPRINGRIGSSGIITGRFSQAEALSLVQTLKAGSLSSTLSYDPISARTYGPQLGEDNLNRGVSASVISVAAVAAFMFVYYFGAGLVAVIALVGNMIIILGVMSLTSATFTLPGIAGLVLTIGMAVDANVLIFERIREELRAQKGGRGADLSAAVRIGFGKAMSSILDANITTLLTCLVLFYTATSEIKGFAVVLSIGIMATLFTTLFGSRVLMDLALIYGKIKRLPMLPTTVPAIERLLHPNIDWFALRKFFIPLSLIIIVLGGLVVYERGEDLLDIEFRSGTEVTFNLAEGKALPRAQAAQRLRDFADAQAVTPEGVDWGLLKEASVVTVGDSADAGATGFSVTTLIEDADAVSTAVKTAFADLLDTTQPLKFDGSGLGLGAADGIVEKIRSSNLGTVLDDPLVNEDISDFRGGVAIVLGQLTPPASVPDIERRITRMRQQPDYVDLGFRRFHVIGLDTAGHSVGNDPLYSRVAVVVSDDETNYIESPRQFEVTGGLADSEWTLIKDALQQDTSLASVSNISSQVSGTMQQQAIVAMILSMLIVVAYIALRFGSFRYGAAAIVALIHDVAAAIGLLAICNWAYDQSWAQAILLDDFKINLAIVAAILTLIGYSLNDTIIVFDRIRENKGRIPQPTAQIINDSINQTISRTVLTSGTTLLAVGVLYFFGGPGVHGFAFTMMIGVFVGTYSSFAIAAPLLLLGQKQDEPQKPKRTGVVAEKKTPTVPAAPARTGA